MTELQQRELSQIFATWEAPESQAVSVLKLIETFIQSAILAEREACTKICDDIHPDCSQASCDRKHTAEGIAEDIRARSNAPETEKEITVKMPPKSRQAGVFTANPAQTIDSKENVAPDPVSA